MRVRLLFFATLKDIVGSREMAVTLPDGATVGDVLTRLEADYPRIQAYRPIVLTAVNEEYTNEQAALAEGDELALFPPVSGGAIESDALVISREREFYHVTRDPIDAQRVARDLQRPEDGAVTVFEGVVRNNSKGKKTRYLEYEGYEPMALKKMEEIGIFVRQAWEIDGVAIVHRLGHMDIGETSVAIVVTSPHRRPAFEACHYAIDRLKKIVPIWKKEFFEDGEVWIEGQ
ncbi:MAG TPA: molybdopterin converting factor subunit 1 [Terriglobia bacterium]|nr:molybdopterin converting factor subunit 1 [Terriglobia bacterium]